MPECANCEHWVQTAPVFCESCFREAESKTAVELAAPELLAACKAIRSWLIAQADLKGEYVDDFCPECMQLHSAITKAEAKP